MTTELFKNRQNLTSYLLPISEALRNSDATLNGQPLNLTDPIVFQFFPDLSGGDVSANYTEPGGTGLGRAESMQIYRNSTNRVITLNATFAATGSAYQTNKDNNRDEFWVQRQVAKLKALTQPIYDRDEITQGTGTFYGPPMVLLTYGYRFINMPVLVTSVTDTPRESTMVTTNSAYPQVVDVTIGLTTNYAYGYVPGYLNWIKQYGGRENLAGQMGYNGSESIQSVLADSTETISNITGVPDNRRRQEPTGSDGSGNVRRFS